MCRPLLKILWKIISSLKKIQNLFFENILDVMIVYEECLN
jgi:hypothetical protein